MDFEYLVPKNVQLRAHISQRSNLWYMKTVLEHFDDRQRTDFRNSCLGFLSEVRDLQFSVQLIQQLVFRCIRTEKANKIWFKVQGHLARFGLQEYALVTGLMCGPFPDDAAMDQVLQKKRLKDKYFKSTERISCGELEKAFLRPSTPRADRYKLRLALIIEGVFNAPDSHAGIELPTLSIVDMFYSHPWDRVS